MNTSCTVQELSPSLGAMVSGINFADKIDQRMILDLLTTHQVLVFHNQEISADRFEAISGMFGEMMKYPLAKGVQGAPNIMAVENIPGQKVKFSSTWHVDSSYFQAPPDIAFLYAVDMPSHGGNTVFTNTADAFDGLSDEMKELCHRLSITNSSHIPALKRETYLDSPDQEAERKQIFTAKHDLLLKHPTTGRYGIFANRAHTSSINELSILEGKAILNMLFEHVALHEYTCRIQWKPSTLVMYDNRATQHRALNDYGDEKRLMWRSTVNLARQYE